MCLNHTHGTAAGQLPSAPTTRAHPAAPLDAAKAEAFGQKMLAAMNGAGLALMASVGHRTGLFDAMARLPAATPTRIAAEAGLSERYVREWLGAMVAAGVVEHEPSGGVPASVPASLAANGTYRLPPEHAAWLTRAATPNNVALVAQWIAVLGSVECQVVEAFGHGRGVPYSAYRRFHEVMADESSQTTVWGLERHILPIVHDLPRRLKNGIDVLDVGCGAGGALIAMASAYRASRFTGYDCSPEAIAAARAEAARRGLRNVHFEPRDVAQPMGERAFDLVTAFDAIHDQAKPAAVLKNIAAALRTAGTFLMADIDASSHHHKNVDHPMGTFLYTISCMHCMSVSLANGGPGLGAAWGEELALEMLRDAGFRHVRVERLPHDAQNSYYVATTGFEPVAAMPAGTTVESNVGTKRGAAASKTAAGDAIEAPDVLEER